MNFFLAVKQWLKKEIPKPLGRWTNECIKKTTKKIDWANEDHCGPCGTQSKPKLKKRWFRLPPVFVYTFVSILSS